MYRYIGLVAVALFAARAADRPDLNGTWQMDAARSQMNDTKVKSRTLAIKQKEDSIVITDTTVDNGGKSRKVEFDCSTEGRDCKPTGVSAKVSFYYSGDRLIMLDTRRGGDTVTKTRITVSGDGKTLTFAVEHIAPPGQKEESLVFAKQ